MEAWGLWFEVLQPVGISLGLLASEEDPFFFFSPLLQASRSSPAKVVAMVHIAGPPALPTVGASHFGIKPVHEDPGIAPLGGTPKEQVPRPGVLARLVLGRRLGLVLGCRWLLGRGRFLGGLGGRLLLDGLLHVAGHLQGH